MPKAGISLQEEKFNEIVGASIAGARRLRGVSAVELAKRAGISRNFLYKIECGSVRCSAFLLTKIASVLAVQVDGLLRGMEAQHHK